MKTILLFLFMTIMLQAAMPLFLFKHTIEGPKQCQDVNDTLPQKNLSEIDTLTDCKDSVAVRYFVTKELGEHAYTDSYVEHDLEICAACSCPSFVYRVFIVVTGEAYKKMEELGFAYVKTLQ